MKNSLYRKVIFWLLVICVILLIAICLKLNIFQPIVNYPTVDLMHSIINNTYFSGVCCSIIAVIVIYFTQIKYSKWMLKKDFRCNEIIDDIFIVIEDYENIADKFEDLTKQSEIEDFWVRRKYNATQFYDFYKKHEAIIDVTTRCLTYKNNSILLESVQSCFFINLNFKLLNIVNNIKNRLSTLGPRYEQVLACDQKYELDKTDETLIALGDSLSTFFGDLECMVQYWKELLDYLEYDHTYIRLFIKHYNSKFSITESLKQPIEIQNLRVKEVNKAVFREMLFYKIQHFWDN